MEEASDQSLLDYLKARKGGKVKLKTLERRVEKTQGAAASKWTARFLWRQRAKLVLHYYIRMRKWALWEVELKPEGESAGKAFHARRGKTVFKPEGE